MEIDENLVRQLIASQFPEWGGLVIRPVEFGGWDNRTFHLGESMIVRLPNAEEYQAQVEKEQHWLPHLAPFLPLPIPVPLAMGKPDKTYPWRWSVYKWIEGASAASGRISNLSEFAISLAEFLAALHCIDSTDGPDPGTHNFYRGDALSTYHTQTMKAIESLDDEIDVKEATEIWENALASEWEGESVWIHGDIAVGNLLVREGKLCAVIDFGCMGVGDPACDLVIAWNLFSGESRKVFKAALPLDENTWARAQGWALWKALITLEGQLGKKSPTSAMARRVLRELLA